MSSKQFSGKSKSHLMAIVRMSGIMGSDEAEAMSAEELAEHLQRLDQNGAGDGDKEASSAAEKAAGARRKRERPETRPATKGKTRSENKPASDKRPKREVHKPAAKEAEAANQALTKEERANHEEVLKEQEKVLVQQSLIPQTEISEAELVAMLPLELREPPKRKRGRPSKKDQELMQAREEALEALRQQVRSKSVSQKDRNLAVNAASADHRTEAEKHASESSEEQKGTSEEKQKKKNHSKPKKETKKASKAEIEAPVSDPTPASTESLQSESASTKEAAKSEKHGEHTSATDRQTDEHTTADAAATVETPDSKEQEKLPQYSNKRKWEKRSARDRKTDRDAERAASAETSAERGDERNAERNAGRERSNNHEREKTFASGEEVGGVLEIMPDGYGFLRRDNYFQGPKDIYIPPQFIRRFYLREGDYITGPSRVQRENDRYQALYFIKTVNGLTVDKLYRRPYFDRLTPIYPDSRYDLETTRNELSTRIIDLMCPIGKGQRGMIVSPPKAGKTILLQKIANAISQNNPDSKLIVLLIDERPEEVTDMQRSIRGEVVYSTFDKTPENHVKIAELVLARAMRMVEMGEDVVILLDSITRLARAYNLTINPTGRTLSGGLDPGALYGPKRFFGAARNIENGGSLTIVSTALIDTGSRMDEVIFEEFKGTGNMEVYLDRKLSEKRIFPAIDINRSGTRREELLLERSSLEAVWSIRKAFGQLEAANVTETIINLMLKTQDNRHFISSINVSMGNKGLFESMRLGTGASSNGSGNNGNGNSGGGGSR